MQVLVVHYGTDTTRNLSEEFSSLSLKITAAVNVILFMVLFLRDCAEEKVASIDFVWLLASR